MQLIINWPTETAIDSTAIIASYHMYSYHMYSYHPKDSPQSVLLSSASQFTEIIYLHTQLILREKNNCSIKAQSFTAQNRKLSVPNI